MNEELLSEFSNILKEKNIDLNSVLSSINNNNSTNNDSISNADSTSDNSTSNIYDKKDNDTDNYTKSNNNTNYNESNSSTDYSGFNNFLDLETILKIKTLFDKYSSIDSKNVQLLMALKPFMRESKKNKIDQYAKMLKMVEVFKTLDLFGGD